MEDYQDNLKKDQNVDWKLVLSIPYTFSHFFQRYFSFIYLLFFFSFKNLYIVIKNIV